MLLATDWEQTFSAEGAEKRVWLRDDHSVYLSATAVFSSVPSAAVLLHLINDCIGISLTSLMNLYPLCLCQDWSQ